MVVKRAEKVEKSSGDGNIITKTKNKEKKVSNRANAVKNTATKKLKAAVSEVKGDALNKKSTDLVKKSNAVLVKTGDDKVNKISSAKKASVKGETDIVSVKKSSSKKSDVVTNGNKNSSINKQFDGMNGSNIKNALGILSKNVARAVGHRKRAIAKVMCVANGKGNITISVNKTDYKRFFTSLLNQQTAYSPFTALAINSGYAVTAEVFGGGKSGQADALKLGLSKCLSLLSEEYARALRKNSFLTRDSRKVEPKKAGFRKARKKEQFSKR